MMSHRSTSRYSSTSEWRTFSNDKDSKDRSRVGDVENRLLSNSGSDLSTMIGPMANGQMSEEYSKFNNRRHMNATDRALIGSFREIGSMADRLHLEARTVDKAKANFKEVYESRSLKGRSNDAIAAACLYIACRQEAVPRTFKDRFQHASIPISQLAIVISSTSWLPLSSTLEIMTFWPFSRL